MTNKTQLVSVPRELLERINKVAFLPVAVASDLWDILAAPAEDVRAVVEEPVSIGTLHRDCDERIVFESAGEIHIKDGMQVFSRPERKSGSDSWRLNTCLDVVEELNK